MLNKNRPYTVTEYVDNSEKKEVDLDQALVLVGKYPIVGNVRHCKISLI